jgi:hypothetical protein
VIEHRGEAIFLPGDPPRRGALALFAPVPPRGPGRRAELTVAVRTGTVVRRTTLDARVVPIAEALGWLAGLPADSDLPASLAAWSVAVKAALGLVARGRLLPAISPGGFDAWRVGPLDPADEEWLSRLAAALPLQAHALPIEGSRPLRVRSAASLLRDCWDAVADCLARSPAAPRLTAHPAFAGQRRVAVGAMREWLAAATQPRQESARPGLRLVPPPQPEQPFSAVLQLRSHADPSLVVDAADLWRAPSAVLRRFGDTVESELLLALRRGTCAWPPLRRVLDVARPDRLELDDEETAQLLGPAVEPLAAAGLEVLWPAQLGGELEARAVVGSNPTLERAGAAAFNLNALLDFRWEVALGGELLTPEEMAALAEAKRPWVRVRGRWVTVDPELLERLRRRRPERVRAADALAAALGGNTRRPCPRGGPSCPGRRRRPARLGARPRDR